MWRHGGGDEEIMSGLVKCMTNKDFKPEVTGWEGAISAITCLSIDQARKEGRVVDLKQHWEKLKQTRNNNTT